MLISLGYSYVPANNIGIRLELRDWSLNKQTNKLNTKNDREETQDIHGRDLNESGVHIWKS
jgi:hypothetical protein